jgi:transcriptional regulator with XRE-family HTH domain
MDNKLPSHIDAHVGRRVRVRREELDMPQERLADTLGVSYQQLQKYEDGKNRIAAGRLFNLAIALDTTIQYFFQGLQGSSRVLRGVAEEGSGFDAGPDPDVLELVKAYRAIDDLAARKSVLGMAKDLARSSRRSPAKKPRKSGR